MQVAPRKLVSFSYCIIPSLAEVADSINENNGVCWMIDPSVSLTLLSSLSMIVCVISHMMMGSTGYYISFVYASAAIVYFLVSYFILLFCIVSLIDIPVLFVPVIATTFPDLDWILLGTKI